MVRFQESKREDRKEPKEAGSSKESKMTVDDAGEKVEIEEPDPKRVKAEAAGSGPAAASAGLPERYDISTPEDAQMSRRSTVEVEETEVSTTQDMIAAVAQNGEWKYAGEKRKTGGHYDKIHEYKKWLEKNGSYFGSSTLANIMDYLDNVTRDEEVLRETRKEELRKLNEVYGAFKPRDRRELSKELTVFGHKWVDKVTEGIAKSRLTCQDFKRKPK